MFIIIIFDWKRVPQMDKEKIQRTTLVAEQIKCIFYFPKKTARCHTSF